MCAHVGFLKGAPVSLSSSPRHPSLCPGGQALEAILHKWETELGALGWVGGASPIPPWTSFLCRGPNAEE